MTGRAIQGATAGPLAALGSNMRAMVGLLGVLWAIEILDTIFLGSSLQRHGIHPRSWSGLWGIVTAPWLHGGWGHLLSNSGPLLVLGTLVLSRGRLVFAEATTVVTLVAGLGTWLTGSSGSNHIGASSIVFGWFGYLVVAGWMARSLVDVAVAVVVTVLYGGIVWGVLPGQPGVSWQGHLFGLVGGVIAARAVAWAHGGSTGADAATSDLAKRVR